MLRYFLWLWILVYQTEATTSPSNPICGLSPCTCNRGKIQCDCSPSQIKEIILENWIIQDYLTTSISVANCNHVHIASLAVSGLPALQQVSLANIASLTLEEQAFSWTTDDPRHSGIVIDISHCVIPEIPSYTFRGNLKDILLTDVNVSQTRHFAFAAIDHAEKLQFTRVRFDTIDSQAFKQLSTNFLVFMDSYITLLPRRTMVNVNVYKEARFQGIKVNSIESSAISFHDIQSFKLVKSTVSYIDRNAIIIQSRGDVSINDNTFSYVEKGAFLGITVESRYLRDAGRQDLVFENNTLTHAERASLAFNATGLDIRLDWIRLDQPCSCIGADFWSNDLVVFYSSSNLTSSVPQVNTLMYCLDPKTSSVNDYQRRNCELSKPTTLLVKICTVVVVILVLVAIGTVVYFTVRKRAKRYINVPPPPPSSLKPPESNKAHMLVVPDGKTYRETELHVIVEHVAPILATEYVKERPDTPD